MTKPPPGDVVLLVLCHHTKLEKKNEKTCFFKQIMPGSKKPCKTQGMQHLLSVTQWEQNEMT